METSSESIVDAAPLYTSWEGLEEEELNDMKDLISKLKTAKVQMAAKKPNTKREKLKHEEIKNRIETDTTQLRTVVRDWVERPSPTRLDQNLVSHRLRAGIRRLYNQTRIALVNPAKARDEEFLEQLKEQAHEFCKIAGPDSLAEIFIKEESNDSTEDQSSETRSLRSVSQETKDNILAKGK
jgi:hypothetical protein